MLLRFYAYSDDSLGEIEKLVALQQSGEIRLLLTNQIVEEHYRNRDRELAESFKRLEGLAPSARIPRFAEHFEEAKHLREALAKSKEAKVALIKVLKAELEAGNLRADKLVENLFASATVLKRTKEDVEKARLRRELGNPPGKKDTLGDQISWEILLRECEEKQDIHFVSRDGDFHGGVVEGLPNQFLHHEWQSRKSAKIFLYRGLAEFAKEHFPNINVPSDAVKSACIKKLVASASFQVTHDVISEIDAVFDSLTSADAITLLQAVIDNPQIHWIIGDPDVSQFYKKLYGMFMFDVPNSMDGSLVEISEDVFGIPF